MLGWRRRRAAVLLALATAAGSATAGCDGGSATPAPSEKVISTPPVSASASPQALAATDWPTYHHDNARSGVAPDFPTAGSPTVAWTAPLDGAVYGQPLVVGDAVFAATENDTVYALDPVTGKAIWQRHLGTPVPRSALPSGSDRKSTRLNSSHP